MPEARSRPIGPRLLAFALLVTLSGCLPVPHPVDPATRPTLDARDLLKFQYRGTAVAIRRVRYSGDSLSGTKSTDSLDARTSYPIAEVTHAEVERYDDPAQSVQQNTFFVVGGLLVVLAILQASVNRYRGSGS